MSPHPREELEALREDALSATRRADFERSARATERWERAHAADVESILAWIDSLRALFGDPPADRRPWRGDDFRL